MSLRLLLSIILLSIDITIAQYYYPYGYGNYGHNNYGPSYNDYYRPNMMYNPIHYSHQVPPLYIVNGGYGIPGGGRYRQYGRYPGDYGSGGLYQLIG